MAEIKGKIVNASSNFIDIIFFIVCIHSLNFDVDLFLYNDFTKNQRHSFFC